ncbi:MAG: hypothetical protein HQL15_01975 [Candidatus Omnitrophica bacterium]|nr:hypothetical protein [Candidatus Omnitrophota bacterium]
MKLSKNAEKKIMANVKVLQDLLDPIEKSGTRIVFFEAPFDKDFMSSPASLFLRQALVGAFPPTKYGWIFPEGDQIYNTTDSIHLDKEGGIRFSNYMLNQLRINGWLSNI